MTYYSITQNLTIVAGGVRDAVRGLANALLKQGEKVELFGVDDIYLKEELESYGSLRLHIHKESRPRKFGFIKGLKNDLQQTINYDQNEKKILELHGLWMYKSIVALEIAKKNNIPLIIHPHGHLDFWALKNKSIIKKIAYHIYEKKTIAQATAFRALSEPELKSIKDFGVKQPVALIANGINLDDYPLNIYVDKNDKPKEEYALYMARITQQKGLETLLKSWARSDLKKHLKLKIAGVNYSGYQEQMIKLTKTLKIEKSIEFIGVIGGIKKTQYLANARLFILPSFSEGFSIALLEAAASKLPIIMTKFCNFHMLAENGGALETDGSEEELVEALNTIYQLNDRQLNEMSKLNFTFIQNNYTWTKIAEQYNEFTRWIIDPTIKKPNFVY